MPTSIHPLSFSILLLVSCASSPPPAPVAPPTQGTSIDALAQAIVRACPPAAPGDEAARGACAEALARNAALRDSLADPVLWGGQRELGNYDLEEANLTRFNPYVWRRMYLSLFTFPGGYTVEHTGGGATVVRLQARFRHELDPGSYPYPFWHKPKKWADYQHSGEIVLVLREGKVRGAMRSVLTPGDTVAKREWDGKWHWDAEREPHNTLFTAIFSRQNPHVARLDASYRALEGALRPYQCTSCHAPDNKMGMNPLDLLVYPNQALTARSSLVRAIEENRMPPETADAPAGIADAAAKNHVLELARAFETAANEALAFEGEPAH